MANYKNKPVENFTQYFRKALRTIMDNYEPPLEASELARKLRVTPQTIHRLLKDLLPGEKLPLTSNSLVKDLEEALNLPKGTADHLTYLMNLDRIEQRLGMIVTVNNTTIPIGVSDAWEKMTPKQKEVVTEIILNYGTKSVLGTPQTW